MLFKSLEPPPVIFKVATNMYVYGNVDFGDAPFVYIQKHPHCFKVKDFLTSTTVSALIVLYFPINAYMCCIRLERLVSMIRLKPLCFTTATIKDYCIHQGLLSG